MSVRVPDSFELVDAGRMRRGFDHLAAKLQLLINDTDCVLLGVMNGGLYPLLQLIQRVRGDYLLDYCHVSRYGDQRLGGDLQWLRRPPETVAMRTVIVVDDIFDEGYTLNAVADACRAAGAVQVYTAVAVTKENPRRGSVCLPDYSTGIAVPDVYVFGCGMDLAGRWRHLPAIYALNDEQTP